MDKLIRHRFWILLALVPPLSIAGYVMANGSIKEANAAKEKELDDTFNAIPSGQEANPKWYEADKGGLAQMNAQLKAAADEERVRVYEEQQARTTWPTSLNGMVPPEYRGKFSDNAGTIFRADYDRLLRALHARVEPITTSRDGLRGKVWLDDWQIPRHDFSGTLSVNSDKMWDAMEDIWYMRLLFDAIREINQPAENAAKAAVRKIYRVELMGGTGESTVKSSGSDGGGMPGRPGGMGGPGGAGAAGMAGLPKGAGMPGLGMGRGGSSQASLDEPPIEFDPAEEYGVPFKSSGGDGGGGGAAPMPGGPGMALPGRGLGGGGADQEELRYIKLDENAKFRERGFYLSVLVDQKRLNDFVVELTNADWPIRIVRFHIGPNPELGGGSGGGSFGGRRLGAMGGDMKGPMAGPGMGRRSARSGRRTAGPDSAKGPAAAAASGPAMPAMFDPISGNLDGAAGPGVMGPSPLLTGDQMAGVLTHPDLVQLDLTGVITFYNPPPEDLVKQVEERRAAAGVAVQTDEAIPAPATGSEADPVVPDDDPSALDELDPDALLPEGSSLDELEMPDEDAAGPGADTDSVDPLADDPFAEETIPEGTEEPAPEATDGEAEDSDTAAGDEPETGDGDPGVESTDETAEETSGG